MNHKLDLLIEWGGRADEGPMLTVMEGRTGGFLHPLKVCDCSFSPRVCNLPFEFIRECSLSSANAGFPTRGVFDIRRGRLHLVD